MPMPTPMTKGDDEKEYGNGRSSPVLGSSPLEKFADENAGRTVDMKGFGLGDASDAGTALLTPPHPTQTVSRTSGSAFGAGQRPQVHTQRQEHEQEQEQQQSHRQEQAERRQAHIQREEKDEQSYTQRHGQGQELNHTSGPWETRARGASPAALLTRHAVSARERKKSQFLDRIRRRRDDERSDGVGEQVLRMDFVRERRMWEEEMRRRAVVEGDLDLDVDLQMDDDQNQDANVQEEMSPTEEFEFERDGEFLVDDDDDEYDEVFREILLAEQAGEVSGAQGQRQQRQDPAGTAYLGRSEIDGRRVGEDGKGAGGADQRPTASVHEYEAGMDLS